MILIDLKDIVRFQGDGHYTTIVTKDDRYLSNLSLADLELRLDNSIYLRVHRSHIVSLPYAVELIKSDESVNSGDGRCRPDPGARQPGESRAIEGTAGGGLATIAHQACLVRHARCSIPQYTTAAPLLFTPPQESPASYR